MFQGFFYVKLCRPNTRSMQQNSFYYGNLCLIFRLMLPSSGRYLDFIATFQQCCYNLIDKTVVYMISCRCQQEDPYQLFSCSGAGWH
jgi:hypothetical protein